MSKPKLALASLAPAPAPDLALASPAPRLSIAELVKQVEEEERDDRAYDSEVRAILLSARAQFGYTLRPFPKGLQDKPANLAGAIQWMRDNGLLDGTQRDPVLSEKGRAVAEKL